MHQTAPLDVHLQNIAAAKDALGQAEKLAHQCRVALEDPEFARSPAGRRLRLALVQFEMELTSVRVSRRLEYR